MIPVPEKYRGQAAVSPKEAAEILGIHPATFYRHYMPHVYSRTILSIKAGGRRCIIVASLLDFVEREARHTP
jgi:hypothetical protein